jgi:hypothetical protein
MQAAAIDKIKRWEIWGTVLIITSGASLHFWFEWTDFWRPMAIFAAVNESTWEHFKLAFWPGLIFAIIEYRSIKAIANNFFAAKFLGLLIMPIITMILFYGYTSILGDHWLIADILVFIVSVIAGQWISLKIMTSSNDAKLLSSKAAIFGLVVMTLAFSLLSYFPLENFVFEDPETGEYGILSHYDHDDHDH